MESFQLLDNNKDTGTFDVIKDVYSPSGIERSSPNLVW